jgi:RNA polymerase sigma-70 factor (ECF subfamily)
MENMNQDLIILLAREGNTNAFRKIYDQYRRPVYHLAYRYTRSQQDAEDIMQETFIKAFKNISKLNKSGPASFQSWLNKITIHTTIEHLRKSKRQQANALKVIQEYHKEPVDEGQSPEETAIREHLLAKLNRALDVLSHKQKIIFDLRHDKHLDIAEIADYLHCSRSNVKTQLWRALNKLRTALDPLWEAK